MTKLTEREDSRSPVGSISNSSTTWLIAPERATPSPTKTYVAKPSRLKPPTEKMNYFSASPARAAPPPQRLERLGQQERLGQAAREAHEAREAQQQPAGEGVDDDSPFTRRIKALERNPALAFAGSTKLRNDDDNDAGVLGEAGTCPGRRDHRHHPRPKKKTAAELQVRFS